MIVDVDIRISNDDGIPLQNFSKRFDGRFEGNRIYNQEFTVQKSFDEFLAEYLSPSGQSYRNNLLRLVNAVKDVSFENNIKSIENYGRLGEDIKNEIPENLEYYIKIGNDQTLSGKIPLRRLAYLNAINGESDILNKEVGIDMKNEINDETTFKNFIKEKNAVRLVSALLDNAINRYEASFYHEMENCEEFSG